MEKLSSYTQLIEKELEGLSIPENPVGLYEPIKYFLNIGGKRIRPILTLLGVELFGVSASKAMSAALAIEVFHNFTLIHDDIMDAAPLRRSMPTVHHKWNNNVAILSGDVMMIQAYQLLSEIDNDKLPGALKLFNKTAIEVCEGQQLDMDFEERTDVTIDEYIEMIRLKTSVLLGCSLQLGSIIAGADEKDQEALYSFGQNVGVAFQIQDDILDLYADADKFGKQVGGDVIANKKTLLYLTALQKATKEQHEVLKQLKSLDDLVMKVSRTRELFDELDVKSDCKVLMEQYLSEAKKALEKINVPIDQKKNLLDLSDFLMQRDI